MALQKEKKEHSIDINLNPMIDVVFLILIYFIVSIQMEPSLDDRLYLPNANYSMKQEESILQIYILKASLNPDGSIKPDSTGLVAFADRAGTPDSCLFCGFKFMVPHPDGVIDPHTNEVMMIPDSSTTKKSVFVGTSPERLVEAAYAEIADTTTGVVYPPLGSVDPNAARDIIIEKGTEYPIEYPDPDTANEGKLIKHTIKLEQDTLIFNPEKLIEEKELEGKNKFCANCGKNVLFIDLPMIGPMLKKRREKMISQIIEKENFLRKKSGKELIPDLPPYEAGKDIFADSVGKKMPLMIKADSKTFYGRIVQVVMEARKIGITNFAFVTSAESSHSSEHSKMQARFTEALKKAGVVKEKKK